MLLNIINFEIALVRDCRQYRYCRDQVDLRDQPDSRHETDLYRCYFVNTSSKDLPLHQSNLGGSLVPVSLSHDSTDRSVDGSMNMD